MSLATLTICPKCAFNSGNYAMNRCFRCVNGSKFEPNLSEVIKINKEKENMYTNTNEIKLTVNNRVCKVDSWSIADPCSPYEMPRIRIDATMTRSAVPYSEYSKKKAEFKIPTIKNVIFNPPATIVLWEDGTKTVVKAENEAFDPEKGLAMAITKKVLGNKGCYFETVKKWTKDVPKGESVENRLNAAYDKGAEDKWAEVEAKFKELNEQLVVGNRITKKFFNAFNEAFAPTPKDDEA